MPHRLDNHSHQALPETDSVIDQPHNTNLYTYCTFHIDDLLFGVEVETVQELIRRQPTTRVPLAPPEVTGLMNLRGQIVNVLSLRHRLGLEVVDESIEKMNVVIRSPHGPISLLVDKIGDVVQVDRNRFEEPPETLTGLSRELIRGVYKLNGTLLLILDTGAITQVATF